MSVNGPPADLVVPPGLGTGRHADAAPDSLLAQLRRDVRQKHQARTATIDLPPLGQTRLRAVYGSLSVDDIERHVADGKIDTSAPLTSNLQILAKACRRIEGQDQDGKWWPLEDDIGPVTFDDRLARLLGWDRPGEEFRYSVKQVYEGMFADDGFALMAHQAKVVEALGLTGEDTTIRDLSQSGEPTSSPSVSPPPLA